MSDSFHSAGDIATEIATRLATCTIALGAETDLGTNVLHGRRTPDIDMIPVCTIVEGTDTPDQKQVGAKAEIEQQYLIFAFIACDPNNPNVAAHKAIRDMKRAIFRTDGKSDARWGGKVVRVSYRGRDIGPRSDGEKFVCAALEFSVNYVEDLGDP